MSWRVVLIESQAKLDYKLGCMVVRTLTDVKRIHVSEMALLILEHTGIALTAHLLYELNKQKVKVICCDPQRNPYAEFLPYAPVHNSTAKINEQLAWTLQAKEALWTVLIYRKLDAQGAHLEYRGHTSAKVLRRYRDELCVGDSTNREGLGAKVYFHSLFGKDFSRDDPNSYNAALNYGYSLLLSSVSREVAIHGYLNQVGLFHRNAFNAYNLACDLMEPLRPLIDTLVYDLNPEKFHRQEKLALLKLFERDVYCEGKQCSFLHAVHLYCASIFRALNSEDTTLISWIEYEW